MRKVRNKKNTYIRQYGYTSGNILELLGKAMQHPGREFSIADDVGLGGLSALLRTKDIALSLINKLKLEKIKVTIKNGILYVKSEFYGSLDIFPYREGFPDATKEDWEKSEWVPDMFKIKNEKK